MSREGRDWAAAQTTGDFTLKAVLDKLGHLADASGLVYHGQSTIAAMMECDRKTITRALQKLEKLRLIRREQRLRQDGSRSTDHIYLKRTPDAEDLTVPEGGQTVPPRGLKVGRVGTDSREGGDRESHLTTFESFSESGFESFPPIPPPGEEDSRSSISGTRDASGPVEAWAEPGTAERLAKLIAAFPEGGRLDAPPGKVRQAFGGLSKADQELAIRAAGVYAAHLRQYPKARARRLDAWLRDERFRAAGVQAAPAAPSQNRVFVREGSPEWEAWAAHHRRLGTPMPTPYRSEMERAEGWRFPSAMPPAALTAPVA